MKWKTYLLDKMFKIIYNQLLDKHKSSIIPATKQTL